MYPLIKKKQNFPLKQNYRLLPFKYDFVLCFTNLHQILCQCSDNYVDYLGINIRKAKTHLQKN